MNRIFLSWGDRSAWNLVPRAEGAEGGSGGRRRKGSIKCIIQSCFLSLASESGSAANFSDSAPPYVQNCSVGGGEGNSGHQSRGREFPRQRQKARLAGAGRLSPQGEMSI